MSPRAPAALAIAAAVLATLAAAQAPDLGRSVHGVVLDAANRPLATAVVYLEDQKTKDIHTAITDNSGAFAFHQLVPGEGYTLYAVWQKHRSPIRADSQYDTSKDLRIDLKIALQ